MFCVSEDKRPVGIREVARLFSCNPHDQVEPLAEKSERTAVVDLTVTSARAVQKRNPWIVLAEGLTLYEDDCTTISKGGWLTDCHIHAAQILLKEQFPHISGMQAPTLAECQAFDLQPGEFVQILNVDQSHWLCVARIGSLVDKIQVYDSLYQSLPMAVKECVAGIVSTQNHALTFQYMNVQRQCNLADCGLHAIAVLTSLCHGVDPTAVTFDPKRLRPHFVACLRKKCMTMFPILRKHRGSSARYKKTEELQVYCTCRKPYSKSRMASCDKCGEWFHQNCEAIPDEVFLLTNPAWSCHNCLNQ